MQLLTSADLHQSSSHHPCLNEIEQWVHNFLGQPHPELGRSGAVCPFVPRALRSNTVYLGAVETSGQSVDTLTQLVQDYCNTFLALEPKTGPSAVYKSILLVFPDVTEEEAPEIVDVIQKRLKPLFVDQGLMIGEFHSRNESPGLHNPDFRPLRSPIPMLAIRFMASSDLPFLSRTTDDPALRLRYLQAYVTRMSGEHHAAKSLVYAQEAIALAEAELRGETVVAAPAKTCPMRPIFNAFKAIAQQVKGIGRWVSNLIPWPLKPNATY
ncbi:MAG: hypothetical protein VKJ64_16065 [Leptolyngbyaceae bacterium]|nr:hypothetical protein [Leptolyngbyaceae bacterium]